MRVRTHRASGIAVAFWILAVAWLCANLQPSTVRCALNWVADGARFSHQQRLTLEVAELLTGEKPVQAVAKTVPAPKPASGQPALAELSFKKLEMLLAGVVAVPPALVRSTGYAVVGCDCRPWLRPAPPHEPPRDDTLG